MKIFIFKELGTQRPRILLTDNVSTERAQLLEYYLHSFRRLWVIARAIVALWLLIIYFSSHTRTFVVLKPSDNKVLLFFHTLGLIKKQQQQQQ